MRDWNRKNDLKEIQKPNFPSFSHFFMEKKKKKLGKIKIESKLNKKPRIRKRTYLRKQRFQEKKKSRKARNPTDRDLGYFHEPGYNVELVSQYIVRK